MSSAAAARATAAGAAAAGAAATEAAALAALAGVLILSHCIRTTVLLGLAAGALAAEARALALHRARTRIAVVSANRLTAHGRLLILLLPKFALLALLTSGLLLSGLALGFVKLVFITFVSHYLTPRHGPRCALINTTWLRRWPFRQANEFCDQRLAAPTQKRPPIRDRRPNLAGMKWSA